jgi:rhodanese-related sulfurtransferase
MRQHCKQLSTYSQYFLLITILLVVGCNSTEIIQYRSISKLSPSQLDKLTSKDSTLKIIDIRTRDHFLQGSIPGAINISVNSNNSEKILSVFDKNLSYLIYCSEGRLSYEVCIKMRELGFKDFYSLSGGYRHWYDSKSLNK